MEFFCAKCKKKHDASLIGFNFWDICYEEVADSVSDLLMDDHEDYADDLERFCRNPQEGKKLFVVPGAEIPGLLPDARRNGQTISGTFTLTLRWLHEKYKANHKKVPDVKEETLDNVIYTRFLKFSFDIVDGQKVLSCVKDENDDPLTDDNKFSQTYGTMFGFRRCCPEGHSLSQAVGKAKEFVIALAGSPRAGKTTCITSISRALRDGIYQKDFGMSMDVFAGDEQWKKLEEEINKYKKGHAVEKTPLDNDNLAYSILVRIGSASRVLTFVDMPGEFWQREDGAGFDKKWYTNYEGIYKNLDCIWFFISKWTAYNITTLSDERKEELQKKTAEHKDQIEKGAASFLNANLRVLSESLKASHKKMPPVAVMLTKGDVDFGVEDVKNVEKYGLFPTYDGMLAPPDAVSGMNLEELKSLLVFSREKGRYILDEHAYWRRAKAVRDFFRDVNAGAFCEAIEQNCPYRTYISMAAYGHPAVNPEGDANGEPLPPTPYHEMLPLLWTFSILGALPVEHPCEWYKESLLGKLKVDAREKRVLPFSYKKLDRIHYEQKKAAEKGISLAKQLKGISTDEVQVITDMGANLLLDEAGKEKYQVTKYHHKRR